MRDRQATPALGIPPGSRIQTDFKNVKTLPATWPRGRQCLLPLGKVPAEGRLEKPIVRIRRQLEPERISYLQGLQDGPSYRLAPLRAFRFFHQPAASTSLAP